MNFQTLLNDAITAIGVGYPVLSCITSVLPQGKVRTFLAALVADVPAVVASLKDLLGLASK
jgi:hypothetical protein